jgi:hypothetical protein
MIAALALNKIPGKNTDQEIGKKNTGASCKIYLGRWDLC